MSTRCWWVFLVVPHASPFVTHGAGNLVFDHASCIKRGYMRHQTVCVKIQEVWVCVTEARRNPRCACSRACLWLQVVVLVRVCKGHGYRSANSVVKSQADLWSKHECVYVTCYCHVFVFINSHILMFVYVNGAPSEILFRVSLPVCRKSLLPRFCHSTIGSPAKDTTPVLAGLSV